MDYPTDAQISRDTSLAWRGDSISDAAQRAARGVPQSDADPNLFQPGSDNVSPDDYILLNTGDAVTVMGPAEAARVIQDGDPTNGGANTDPRPLVPIVPWGPTGFPRQQYYTRADWIDYTAPADSSGKNLPVSSTQGVFADASGAFVAGKAPSAPFPAWVLLLLIGVTFYAAR